MKAKVTAEFSGRPDAEPLPRTIAVGEIIAGDLAVVAVREGWADSIGPAPSEHANPLDGMTVTQLKTFASEQSIDIGDAAKKDDIRAAIELALEAKKQA